MANLYRFRHLAGIMVYRDVVGRYKSSLLGSFWPLINPIGHLLLYTFVFNVILQVRFGNNAGPANFALYLMTGLIPWGAFSEAIARSSVAILEVPNLVKRVVFPLEIVPAVIAVSSMLSQVLALCLLVGATLLYTHQIHWTILLLPIVVIPQLLFTTGLGYLLSSLGVYIRDLQHFLSLMLSVWMYATPIVYPASRIPANFQFLLWTNPLAGIVGDYRRLIIEGALPDWSSYALYTLISVCTWALGFFFFYKTKRSFADVI